MVAAAFRARSSAASRRRSFGTRRCRSSPRADAMNPNLQSSVERWAHVLDQLAKRLRVEVVGLERLPRGRALIVANHAFGFWDLALAVARIRVATGRPV